MTSVDEPARTGARTRDAARTQAEILDVATREFARAATTGPVSTRSPHRPAPRNG